ncbi:MAG TPA: diguanylate cyclase [Elusimicrobiales bacterium]|nr:diguanylate cyclase [Elusimicrobiales bacterium]
MLRANAFAKVACPAAIVAALGWGLWLWPAYFLWLYPAAGALFLWFHWSGEKEVKYIFLFLVTAAGFMLPKLVPGGDSLSIMAAALAEVLCLWLLFFALSWSESSRRAASEKLAVREAEAAARITDLQDGLARYRLHQAGTLARIRDKGALSASVQEIGAASTSEEIKERLEKLLKKYFPGAEVALHSGAPRDFADTWVAERKTPLLVRNSHEDSRFARGLFAPGVRSLMALPLHLFGALVGFVRVAAPEPDRFKSEDLRGAELFCALAGVSMENICLFDKVRELAIKDGLTGLYTHRAFQTRLEEEILRSARTRTPFSLIMADIDHFKSYNDNFGHQAGDAVLKAVAEVLAGGVRDVDFSSRYGGEEFALILTGAGKTQAAAVADGLRRAVEARSFSFGGRSTRVTASFGVAEFPSEGAITSQLVRAADERLYRAKETGRNRVVYE